METRITRTAGGGEAQQKPFVPSPFRLFEDFFNDWASRWMPVSGREWRPPVDILERDGDLILRVEMPGVNEKDMELKLEGDTLIIRGEKKLAEDKGVNFHQSESFFGTFSRSFSLPDTVDKERIQADYKNGVLTISIPSKAEVKPRTIKISH